MKYILFLINDFRWAFKWTFPIRHPRYSISIDGKTGAVRYRSCWVFGPLTIYGPFLK